MTSIKTLQTGFPGKAANALLYLSSITYVRHDGLSIICDVGPISIRKNLIKTLRQENIDPASIDYVFITHLHHDHAANIDLFPNATVIMSEREWEYANDSGDQAIQKAYLPLFRDMPKLFVREDGQEIIPGIRAWLVPGHTPGSMCCSFCLDGETCVIAGDAVKNRRELETGDVALSVDRVQSRMSISKIKAIGGLIIPGHDCMLKVEDGAIVPMAKNELVLVFPEGMTVNGCNPLILHVD